MKKQSPKLTGERKAGINGETIAERSSVETGARVGKAIVTPSPRKVNEAKEENAKMK